MQKPEKYVQGTGRVLSVSTAIAGKVCLTFKTIDGDRLKAVVPADMEAIKDICADDVVFIEYFQKEETEFVRIESISKMNWEVIYSWRRDLDSKEFHIKRAAIQKDLGYRRLFVDKDLNGFPVKAFFLMNDFSLVIIRYGASETENQPQVFASAREYLNNHARQLDNAGKFDAIRLLADELNSTN
jgi:hypothetical protein